MVGLNINPHIRVENKEELQMLEHRLTRVNKDVRIKERVAEKQRQLGIKINRVLPKVEKEDA